MRTHMIGVLLVGLLSLSSADSVKTKDGHSYQGTVQYSDADTIKVKLADSDEVKILCVNDVEEILVDSPADQPAPLEKRALPYERSAAYWEQQGYADGSRRAGLKSALAGVGSCIGVPVGGYVGAVAASADPSASNGAACCIIGAAAGGAAGCLGGSALGTIGQSEVVGPTLDSARQGAYRRGFQRGVRYSNNIANGVGAGATALSVAGIVFLMIAWSDM